MKKISFRPGLNVQRTQLANEGGWSSTNLIRFRDGMPEVIGGWQLLFQTPPTVAGVPRGIHAWAALDGTPMLAYGTNLRLYASFGITPTYPTNPFSTTNGSPVVTITDPSAPYNLRVGTGIYIYNATNVGGTFINNGSFSITKVLTQTTFQITTSSNATSTATGGGSPTFIYNGGQNQFIFQNDITPFYWTNSGPTFDTTSGLNIVVMHDTNLPPGLQANGLIGIDNPSSTVGGLTFTKGQVFPIKQVLYNAVAFYTPTNATSTVTGASAGMSAVALYYVMGPSNATAATVNSYYSFPPPVIWSLDNFGDTLIACPNMQATALEVGSSTQSHSNIFVWSPDTQSGFRAYSLDAVGATAYPTIVSSIFVSNGAEQVIALGGYPAAGGTYSPMLVSWCNNGDYTTWVAAANNNAGDFQLIDGSQLLFGGRAAQQNLIWSDTALYSMQFIGGVLVYGFTQIGTNCGAIGPQAVAIINGVAFWMNKLSFMTYNGTVSTIPCPIWDLIFKNLNTSQSAKVICRINSQFNKVRWDWPSATGSGENDSFCEFDYVDGTWSYSSNSASGGVLVARTAWTDVSVWGVPIALDASGNIWQHEAEGVYDGNGVPLPWSLESGFVDIAEGEEMLFVDMAIPDQIMNSTSGTPQYAMAVYVSRYPSDTLSEASGQAFTVTPTTEFVLPRGRGRQVAFKFSQSGSAPNTFVRLGAPRVRFAPDGRN